MGYTFDWVDAFADRPFSGNGCVVVHGAADISVSDRLALVRETSLAECEYLVGSDVADFGARYYLADKEILMAGHPTVATVASLIHRGLVDLSTGSAEFTLEVGAGVLPISVSGDGLITMTQMAAEFGPTFEAGAIAGIYGFEAQDVLGTPQVVSTGTAFCITVLRSKEALRQAVLDYARLDRFRRDSGVTRAELMEPFLVTLGGETAQGETFSRLLLAPPSLPEDPFTGLATGCMAAYLWANGLIDGPRFVAEQGHWMGRPGRAEVEVLGPRDAISGVRVGGRGYVPMSGELSL
ncbi:MAG: PhzF family phenazine biosynthesis protein [Paracoccaceae bacterium]